MLYQMYIEKMNTPTNSQTKAILQILIKFFPSMKYNLYILLHLYPCQAILSTRINVWLVVKYSISAVFLSLAVNQHMW